HQKDKLLTGGSKNVHTKTEELQWIVQLLKYTKWNKFTWVWGNVEVKVADGGLLRRNEK
ncbi:unnamed protein product, partial [Allacma fusca]